MIINFKTPNKTSSWVVSKNLQCFNFFGPPPTSWTNLTSPIWGGSPNPFFTWSLWIGKILPKKKIGVFFPPKIKAPRTTKLWFHSGFSVACITWQGWYAFFEGAIEMWICCKKNGNKWEGNNRKRLNACVVCIYIYIYVYVHIVLIYVYTKKYRVKVENFRHLSNTH